LSSPVTESLKKILENLPWPYAVAVNRENYETVKNDLPPGPLERRFAGAIGCFGLRIFENDTVPPGQIHFVTPKRDAEGEWYFEITKIVNIGR
jgi:hypothetical protein